MDQLDPQLFVGWPAFLKNPCASIAEYRFQNRRQRYCAFIRLKPLERTAIDTERHHMLMSCVQTNFVNTVGTAKNLHERSQDTSKRVLYENKG